MYRTFVEQPENYVAGAPIFSDNAAMVVNHEDTQRDGTQRDGTQRDT